ncbi:MAG: NAD(P)/FAD-dependent oxidoreductase [Pleurocapsa sp.]
MNDQPVKVCIVGGGFGGLYTALYLSGFSWVKLGKCEVTLIEPKDNFLFTPLLYEILTGELQRWEIAPSYQKLLAGSNVNWIQDKVESINLKDYSIRLESSLNLDYDYLVLAAGKKTKFVNISGLATHALTFRSIFDAEILQERLRILEASDKQINIAVIGAGANGVELACKISDRLQGKAKILLIDRGDTILKDFNPGIQKAARKAIHRRNIQVLLSSKVEQITSNSIILSQEERITKHSVDLVLWTAGTETIDWVDNLNCQQNKLGQLLTRPTLQLIDYPEVLALGDIAEIRNSKTKIVPTTAQAAYQQASTAAKNLQALILNKQLQRFYYLHLGDMLTLGKGDAIISSFGINLTGFVAGILRRLIYIQRLPTIRHRWQVFKNLFFGNYR